MDLHTKQFITDVLTDELHGATSQILHWEHQLRLPVYHRVIGEEITADLIRDIKKYKLNLEKALKQIKDVSETNLQPSKEDSGDIPKKLPDPNAQP